MCHHASNKGGSVGCAIKKRIHKAILSLASGRWSLLSKQREDEKPLILHLYIQPFSCFIINDDLSSKQQLSRPTITQTAATVHEPRAKTPQSRRSPPLVPSNSFSSLPSSLTALELRRPRSYPLSSLCVSRSRRSKSRAILAADEKQATATSLQAYEVATQTRLFLPAAGCHQPTHSVTHLSTPHQNQTQAIIPPAHFTHDLAYPDSPDFSYLTFSLSSFVSSQKTPISCGHEVPHAIRILVKIVPALARPLQARRFCTVRAVGRVKRMA